MIGATVVLVGLTALGQAPRDGAAPATGAAAIAGTVVTDAQPPRPVRRAIVTINSADRAIGRTVVTDDRGRFQAADLPAGRYAISASKRGWVSAAYGARAIGRPGSPLSLAEGQGATITLPLARAGVITGTVLDQNGVPPTSVSVRVQRYGYVFNTGERRLLPVASSGGTLDERGMYRIYGLTPGEYYVTAQPNQGFGAPGRDLHLTSDVDVQQAARAIQDGPAVPVTDVPQRSVSLSTVFFPGAVAITQATPVAVRAGEERTGVDFVIQYVPAVRIDGTVSAPEGPPPAGTMVNLISTDPSAPAVGFEGLRTSRTNASGGFSFSEVTPGPYMLAARAGLPGPGGAADAMRWVWANTELEVSGEDLRDLSLPLLESLTVSGTVVFDGTAPHPVPAAVRLGLQPDQSRAASVTSGSVPLGADGRFTIAGVTPGRYRLTASTSSPQAVWTLRSAVIGGQDTVQLPVAITQSADDVVITLTDRIANLTGRVQGDTAADYSIILFPSDRAQWSAQSGRVVSTRAASDGSYVVKNVRPGEYQIAAVNDVEPGEWNDPSFLQRIAATAVRVTIAEGENKVQDVRAGGG